MIWDIFTNSSHSACFHTCNFGIVNMLDNTYTAINTLFRRGHGYIKLGEGLMHDCIFTHDED